MLQHYIYTIHIDGEEFLNIPTNILHQSQNKNSIQQDNNPFKVAGDLMKLALSALLSILTMLSLHAFQCEAYILPDTGFNKCTDGTKEIPCPQKCEPFYGQDGNFRGVQPAFKDNGNGTTTDSVTGITWQVESNSTTYKFYDAEAHCQSLTLADKSDWRVPTRREFLTITLFDRNFPAFDPVFNIESNVSYWTRDLSGQGHNLGWFIWTGSGQPDYGTIENTFFVKCVRGNSIP